MNEFLSAAIHFNPPAISSLKSTLCPVYILWCTSVQKVKKVFFLQRKSCVASSFASITLVDSVALILTESLLGCQNWTSRSHKRGHSQTKNGWTHGLPKWMLLPGISSVQCDVRMTGSCWGHWAGKARFPFRCVSWHISPASHKLNCFSATLSRLYHKSAKVLQEHMCELQDANSWHCESHHLFCYLFHTPTTHFFESSLQFPWEP